MMAAKWIPVEVAGAVFIYSDDTPFILGNYEGTPVFVVPGDDGIHNAWAEAEKLCEAHNDAIIGAKEAFAALVADNLATLQSFLPERVAKDLAALMERSTRKHGTIESDMAALGVITEEYHEVIEAMRGGEAWKIRAELLDLASPCLRRIIELDKAAGHG